MYILSHELCVILQHFETCVMAYSKTIRICETISKCHVLVSTFCVPSTITTFDTVMLLLTSMCINRGFIFIRIISYDGSYHFFAFFGKKSVNDMPFYSALADRRHSDYVHFAVVVCPVGEVGCSAHGAWICTRRLCVFHQDRYIHTTLYIIKILDTM